MVTLPIELFIKIAAYCDFIDLLTLRLVCKDFRDVIDISSNTHPQFTDEMRLYNAISKKDEEQLEAFVKLFHESQRLLKSKTIISAVNTFDPLFFYIFTNLIPLEKTDIEDKLVLVSECSSRLKYEQLTDELIALIVTFAMKVMRSMSSVDIKTIKTNNIIYFLNLGYYDDKIKADLDWLNKSSNFLTVSKDFSREEIIARYSCLYHIACAVESFMSEASKRSFMELFTLKQTEMITNLLSKAKSSDPEWFKKWIEFFDEQTLTKAQANQFKQIYQSLLEYPTAQLTK